MESRFGGEPLLAGVQWSVGVFWDVEAAKERGNQGKRVQGFSRCWGARELTCWGGAEGSPRRRRGGSREELLGGVAKGVEVQREGRGRRGASMRRVEASRREVAREGGPERWAGGARHRRRERAERERQRKGKRDLFAISKISMDLNVKQG